MRIIQEARRALSPAYLAFCRDWDVQPRACAPHRARTKGKTEAGVKYVKRNALADLHFETFAALETHLADWLVVADQGVHGTTHEAPIVRFERDERAACARYPCGRCRAARAASERRSVAPYRHVPAFQCWRAAKLRKSHSSPSGVHSTRKSLHRENGNCCSDCRSVQQFRPFSTRRQRIALPDH